MGYVMINFVEVRNQQGKWVKIGPIFPHESFKSDKPIEYSDEPFDATNYDLYALLGAKVRITDITPITTLKGLPDDSEYLNSKEDDFMLTWNGETRKEAILSNDNGRDFSHIYLLDLLQLEERKSEYIDTLGPAFFKSLDLIKTLGQPTEIRLIYWFA